MPPIKENPVNPRIRSAALRSFCVAALSFATLSALMVGESLADHVPVPAGRMHFEELPTATIPREDPVGPAEAPVGPAYNGEPDPRLQGPEDAVTIDTGDGVATTGPAEAGVAAVPIDDDAAYRYDLCLQLQEAKPWIDWGCTDPAAPQTVDLEAECTKPVVTFHGCVYWMPGLTK